MDVPLYHINLNVVMMNYNIDKWDSDNCTRTHMGNDVLITRELFNILLKAIFRFKIVLVILIFSAFKTVGQINVSFTGDILQGCSPISVAFTNGSFPLTGSTFLWDFGNGNFSTAQNPQTSYLIPGTYSVSLTVTNGGISETLIKEQYITVHPKPQAGFKLVGDTIGCSPFLVSFQDLSTNIDGSDLSYTWSFGDGSKSTLQNPAHNYLTRGNFDVTVLVTNVHGCSDSYTESQLVHVLKPQAAFGVDETNSCTGTLLSTFTNISAGTTALVSLWDFGDGTSSTQFSPVHQYQNQGNYSVKLRVTDAFGCSDEVIRTNLIRVIKTTARFGMSRDTLCPGQNLVLTNQSTHATSYLWRTGDQGVSTLTNLNKIYNNAGDYTIWLIASNGTCKDSISKKVNVEYVKADFLVSEPFICELPKTINYQNQSQNAVSWSWRFGNGNTSTSQNPAVEYLTSISLINKQALFSDTLVATSKQIGRAHV